VTVGQAVYVVIVVQLVILHEIDKTIAVHALKGDHCQCYNNCTDKCDTAA
jgi:hypothetical protein